MKSACILFIPNLYFYSFFSPLSFLLKVLWHLSMCGCRSSHPLLLVGKDFDVGKYVYMYRASSIWIFIIQQHVKVISYSYRKWDWYYFLEEKSSVYSKIPFESESQTESLLQQVPTQKCSLLSEKNSPYMIVIFKLFSKLQFWREKFFLSVKQVKKK